jgi:peptidoglycan/LPS O-acetylase OafA/YrhL
MLVAAVPLAFALEALGARWLVFSLTALASAAFLYLALFSSQRWLHAVLTARFVVYTGTISYGLYLLHKVPLDVAQALHFDRHPALALIVALGTAYALAVVSRRWFEQPFLRLKRLFEPKAHRAELAPVQLVAIPK